MLVNRNLKANGWHIVLTEIERRASTYGSICDGELLAPRYQLPVPSPCHSSVRQNGPIVEDTFGP